MRLTEARCIREMDASMPKIIWSCSDCGTVLPIWKITCSNCHRLALSWLHLIVAGVVVLPGLFLVMRLF